MTLADTPEEGSEVGAASGVGGVVTQGVSPASVEE